MTELNFPNPPWTDGQVSGNYVYSTARGLWESKPLTGPKSTYGVQPPLNPQAGDEWINSNDMTAFGWYVDTDGGQWVEKTASISANGYYSPNYIINGAFDIWQRGTSFASSSTGVYTSDRWAFGASGSTGRTASRQSTGLTGFQYCARIQRDSGQTNTNNNYFAQSLESISSIPLSGKTVTISYYARAGANYSSTGNAFSAYLYSGTGTDQNIMNVAITGQATVATSSVTLTTSWQRFTATGTVSASANQLFFVAQNTPTGTAGAADYFEITGVQLEEGSVATPFRRNANSIQGELAACQRYYQRINADVVYGVLASGIASNASTAVFNVPLKVKMRIPPVSLEWSTIGVWDANNFDFNVSSNILRSDVNNSNFAAMTLTVSPGSMTAYRPYWILSNNSTLGYLGFSAEL